jgi:exodeoxyribonuclease VII large subunit
MEPESTNLVTYSPAAVLNLLNNAIAISTANRIIQLKGIYVQTKSGLYGGYYDDSFRDESSDVLITVLVPPLIRNELQPNKTITVNGFISKRVNNSSGSIQIQLTVTDLVAQTQNKYGEEDIRKIQLMQAKASSGFRDVYGWLKEAIINEDPFKIGVIIGKTGIIDNDIKHQLRESIGFYKLSFHRINLSSEAEITGALDQLESLGFDIIVISRGGGENMEVFNKLSLAERATKLKPLFVTAIGHKDDVMLLQKVADKSFITPSEFGQFLNDTYNHTVAELENSRAKLIESVKAQLTANYQKEIDNLKEKLKTVEELKTKSTADLEKIYQEKITGLNEQIALVTKNYNDQKAETQNLQNEKVAVLNQQIQALKVQISGLENKSSFSWVAVIIGIIIGLIIAFAIKSH